MDENEISQLLQEEAGEVRRPRGVHILQSVVRPSFGTPEVIDVYALARGKQFIAVMDCQGTLKEVELAKPDFERLYEGVCCEPLPVLLPDGPMGMDGTAHELWIRRGSVSCRLVWWHEMPSKWGEFHAKATAIIGYLREQFRQDL